jgi:hypothetical protein
MSARTRRQTASRSPVLPGFPSTKSLLGRDPVVRTGESLALELQGRTATVVGIDRRDARRLLTEAGVPRMMRDPGRDCLQFPARYVDDVRRLVLLLGGTVVLRPLDDRPRG